MKALKIAGIVVTVLIVTFFGGAALLPSHCHVERGVEIKAPPSVVYAYLMDLSKTPDWSPFHAMEPTAKTSFTGTPGQNGQVWAWEGQKLGTGTNTLVESTPNAFIHQELLFHGKDKAEADFRMIPSGEGTQLTWTFDSEMGYPAGRWMGLMMSSFMGGHYDTGLTNLKNILEKR
jgi:uncharacterized protein YndB with AHSA1/START domain